VIRASRNLVIGDQDRDAAVAQVADNGLDAVDGYRIDAGERLIEQNNLRVRDKCAGDFQFVVVRRPKATSPCCGAAFQFRIAPSIDPPCGCAACVHAEHLHHAEQILLYRELAEDARFLGQVAHAAFFGAAVTWATWSRPFRERDVTGVRIDHPHAMRKEVVLPAPLVPRAQQSRRINFEFDAIDHAAAPIRFHETANF